MPKRLIFLIDDDPIFQAVVEHILQREGYELVKAVSGLDAVQVAETMSPLPDLIICDIMLPFIDGLRLITLFRARAGWEHIPIVMLTANGQEKDIQKALENGADDYLVKPFQHGELLARIRRYLR
jgi:two-component system alkaline phosphatase synthesis response regulator PhoP